ARVELQEIAAERAPVRAQRPWWIAIALAIIAVAGVMIWKRPPAPRSTSTSPKLTQLTFAEGVEEFPAWSADGKSIVYSGELSGIRKLFIKHLGSNETQQLTKGDYDDLQPTWSPDGKRIVFVRGREPRRHIEVGDPFGYYEATAADLWVIDLQSGREDRLVEGAFYPSFSPDGKKIA